MLSEIIKLSMSSEIINNTWVTDVSNKSIRYIGDEIFCNNWMLLRMKSLLFLLNVR